MQERSRATFNARLDAVLLFQVFAQKQHFHRRQVIAVILLGKAVPFVVRVHCPHGPARRAYLIGDLLRFAERHARIVHAVRH